MMTIHPKSKNTVDYAIADPVCKAPAEKITLLRFADTLRIIVLAGLDTQPNRWIRHPQDENQAGKFVRHIQYGPEATSGSLSLCGARIGAKRLDRKAPSRVPAWAHVLRLPIHPVLNFKQGINMLYQFLICSPGRKLAELSRVRIVSAFGRSEAEARAHLAGPNLVFLSRTPARKGGAA
ncbi:hypothetical protein [Oceanimonas doudoroffii]|uniref:hypothetical protein n=1 Tax=Oceanimonas doudoroffii TaxID=84158 RepID=UPI0011406509|nr:hypothetical protein [Oceanimonas doudoroffii]